MRTKGFDEDGAFYPHPEANAGGGIHSTGILLFVHINDTVGASSRVFVQAVGVRVFKATTQ